MQPNPKMLIGAVVAAALAFAVYYGLVSQQTATNIQNTANQQLGTAPANQAPQGPTTQASAPPAPAPANTTAPPKQ